MIEAQATSSKKDFARFYNIALKSANETKYWLGLLRDGTPIKNTEVVEELLQEVTELSKILGASLKTLRKNIKKEKQIPLFSRFALCDPRFTLLIMKKDKKLIAALSEIIDPELFVPITDLGLIYGAHIDKNGVAKITMTLTTIGCPLFDVIREDIEKVVGKVEGVRDVDIELTFEPPWSTEMMSESAKIELGLM